MSIKILTKNSIDNTNIDGARQNHFSAGMRSGIVKGAFNEGRFFASASNIIALDICELRISGHQVVIDSTETITLNDRPNTPTKYSMIAEIQVSDNSVPSFRLFIQPANVSLKKDNLFKTNNGSGTYQLRIGNFTLGTTGLISDVVRTADIITGGGEGEIADIKFNATATQLSSSSQPEVNADYNEETKEWDLHFGIPAGGGSRVTIGGVEQPTWSADFAESERQKTINLLNKNTTNYTRSGANRTILDTGVRVTTNSSGTFKYVIFGVEASLKAGQRLYFHSDVISPNNQFAIKIDGSSDNATYEEIAWRTIGNFSVVLNKDYNYIKLYLYATVSNNVNAGVYVDYTNLVLSLSPYNGYQPYNGAIVHEKQLNETSNEIKNIKENIYQHTDAINLRDSTLTTLDEFFKMFDLDTTKTYRLSIEPNIQQNFKDVVGNPPRTTDGNYRQWLVKMISTGVTNQGENYHPYRIYKIIAGLPGEVTGIKYVKRNADDTYYQGQWNEVL